MKAKVDPAAWFLNDSSDVRSSFYLEEVATEFDVQGLELDWVGDCWDANFRHDANLGIWVGTQRSKRAELSPERVGRLEAIGFVWDAR